MTKTGESKRLPGLLGKGASFEGTLVLGGTVSIDGSVTGKIYTEGTLVIGEGASIMARIEAGKVVIRGTVLGEVHAREGITLKRPGRLFGDVVTTTLAVEEGVIFEGQCHMRRITSEDGSAWDVTGNKIVDSI